MSYSQAYRFHNAHSIPQIIDFLIDLGLGTTISTTVLWLWSRRNWFLTYKIEIYLPRILASTSISGIDNDNIENVKNEIDRLFPSYVIFFTNLENKRTYTHVWFRSLNDETKTKLNDIIKKHNLKLVYSFTPDFLFPVILIKKKPKNSLELHSVVS